MLSVPSSIELIKEELPVINVGHRGAVIPVWVRIVDLRVKRVRHIEEMIKPKLPRDSLLQDVVLNESSQNYGPGNSDYTHSKLWSFRPLSVPYDSLHVLVEPLVFYNDSSKDPYSFMAHVLRLSPDTEPLEPKIHPKVKLQMWHLSRNILSEEQNKIIKTLSEAGYNNLPICFLKQDS